MGMGRVADRTSVPILKPGDVISRSQCTIFLLLPVFAIAKDLNSCIE
jgi:hypothetical protein